MVRQGECDVDVEVTPTMLGSRRLPLALTTSGLLEQQLEVHYDCVGPTLHLTSSDRRFHPVDSHIAFGLVRVLDVVEVPLQLKNVSPIATHISFAFATESPCFEVRRRHRRHLQSRTLQDRVTTPSVFSRSLRENYP